MRTRRAACGLLVLSLLIPCGSFAADHNDPNSINSIFWGIPPDPADLYDMFGWPSDDTAGGEKVVVALTFASMPATGVFDHDLLYRILIDPDPRTAKAIKGDESLAAFFRYAKAVEDKFLRLKASEIRVTVDPEGKAHVDFIDFPGGSFSKVVNTNEVAALDTPDGHSIKAYIGGRDDAFFNDLPGFFRSINYAPQFYQVPLAMKDKRELLIPKTLLELEGNELFNFDPANPQHGKTVKEKLPPGDLSFKPTRFLKDANGNFRFVYSGEDAQKGMNVNAIILEIPLAFVTKNPQKDRVVNTWGESWIRKASGRVPTIPDKSGAFRARRGSQYDDQLKQYKRVDTDGVPFSDAALSEREDNRQLGASDLKLARHFVKRLGHLGWGFGPSVSALGLGTCFDHDNAPVSRVEFYRTASAAFPRVKKCLFQELNMPDGSWNKKGLNIPQKRPFEVFVPNVCAIDMDTTGTWPFGRRLEDQVATRFLSVFLDMEKGCGGQKCTVETLGDQALWDGAPIEPKTPPNPLKNDKEFLATFPYLADPWP